MTSTNERIRLIMNGTIIPWYDSPPTPLVKNKEGKWIIPMLWPRSAQS